jgi:hypothetical protein
VRYLDAHLIEGDVWFYVELTRPNGVHEPTGRQRWRSRLVARRDAFAMTQLIDNRSAAISGCRWQLWVRRNSFDRVDGSLAW